MNMKKRFLSAALALSMIVSFIPNMVYAGNTTEGPSKIVGAGERHSPVTKAKITISDEGKVTDVSVVPNPAVHGANAIMGYIVVSNYAYYDEGADDYYYDWTGDKSLVTDSLQDHSIGETLANGGFYLPAAANACTVNRVDDGVTYQSMGAPSCSTEDATEVDDGDGNPVDYSVPAVFTADNINFAAKTAGVTLESAPESGAPVEIKLYIWSQNGTDTKRGYYAHVFTINGAGTYTDPEGEPEPTPSQTPDVPVDQVVSGAEFTIDDLTIGQARPETATKTSGDNFTFADGAIDWSASTDSFLGDGSNIVDANSTYTGKITLTANDGYTFTGYDGNNFKINSQAPSNIELGSDGKTLTLSYTVTTGDLKATSIAVKTAPTLAYGSGSQADFSGAVATITYNNTLTKDVAWSDFGTYGLSITNETNNLAVHGATLQTSNNGDTIQLNYASGSDNGSAGAFEKSYTLSSETVSLTANVGNLAVTDSRSDIAAGNVVLEAPVIGADGSMLDTTADYSAITAGIASATVSWGTPTLTANNKIDANTNYTATITLTPLATHKFPTDVSGFTVNGQTPTSATVDGSGNLVLTYTFTTGNLKVTSAAVKTQPTKLAYNAGDAISYDGAEITLTYNNGETADVTAANFASYGLTPDITSGTTLTTADNSKTVKVTYNNTGDTASAPAGGKYTLDAPDSEVSVPFNAISVSQKITEVSATLAFPAAGETIPTTATPGNSNYTIDSTTGIIWYEGTPTYNGEDGAISNTEVSDTKFGYNKKYFAVITFDVADAVKATHSFADAVASTAIKTGDTTKTVSGTQYYLDEETKQQFMAVFEFDPTAKEPATVTKISVDKPVAKGTPDTSAEPAATDKGYTVTAVTWKKTDDNTPVAGVFGYDTGYTATMTITPGSDYVLPSNIIGTGTVTVPNATSVTVTDNGNGTYNVTAVFPATGSRTEITEINLSVTDPAAGNSKGTPTFSSSDTSYTIGTVTEWSGEFATGDKFDYGKTYTTTVVLTADDDHRFADAESITAKVNNSGTNVSVTVSDDKTTAMITYTPKTASKTLIPGVSLTVTAPVAKAEPANGVTKNNLQTNYTVDAQNGASWTKTDGNTSIASPSTYDYDTQYTVSVTVTPVTGHMFNDSTVFKINDTQIVTSGDGANGTITPNDDGTYTVTYNFPKTAAKQKITAVNVTGVTAASATNTATTAGIGATAKIGETQDNNALTLGTTEWQSEGATFTGSFEGGKSYTISATVTPNEGYEFDENLTATVNDGTAHNATIVKNDDGTATVTYTYDVKNIVITAADSDITPPVPFENPAQSGSITTSTPASSFDLTSVTWTNADSSAISGAYASNTEYKVTVVYTAKTNYEFSDTEANKANYKAEGWTANDKTVTISGDKTTATLTYTVKTAKNVITAIRPKYANGTDSLKMGTYTSSDDPDGKFSVAGLEGAILTRTYGDDLEVAYADFGTNGIVINYSGDNGTTNTALDLTNPMTQETHNGKTVHLVYTDSNTGDANETENPVVSDSLGTLDVRKLWTVKFFRSNGDQISYTPDGGGADVSELKIYDGDRISDTQNDLFKNAFYGTEDFNHFENWVEKGNPTSVVEIGAEDGTLITKDMELQCKLKPDRLTAINFVTGFDSITKDTYGENATLDPSGVKAALSWEYQDKHEGDDDLEPSEWASRNIKIYYSDSATVSTPSQLTNELTLTTPLKAEHNGKYLYLVATDPNDATNKYATKNFGQLTIETELHAKLNFTTTQDNTGNWTQATLGGKTNNDTLTETEVNTAVSAKEAADNVNKSTLATGKWENSAGDEVSFPLTFSGSSDIELWAQAKLPAPTNVTVTSTEATAGADGKVATNEKGGFTVNFTASTDKNAASYTVNVKSGDTVVATENVAKADVAAGAHFDAADVENAADGLMPGATYTVEVVANPAENSHKIASDAATGSGTPGKMYPTAPTSADGKYYYRITNANLEFQGDYVDGWTWPNVTGSTTVSAGNGQIGTIAFIKTDKYIGVTALEIKRNVAKGDVEITTPPTLNESGKLVVGQTVTLNSSSAVADDAHEGIDFEVTGTWTLVDTTLESEGKNSLTYTFTPTDNTNYNNTEGEIEVNNVVQQYTLTLKYNYTGADPENYYTEVIDKGSKVTVGEGHYVAPTDQTRLGWGFGGWYENDACTGSAVDVENLTMTADTTLYAKWVKTTYTVKFDLNDGGDTVSPAIGKPSDITNLNYEDTINAPAAPTRNGYKFKGWYVDVNDEGTKWVFNGEETDATKVTYSVTLKAKWEINKYTVNWYTTDHSTAAKTEEVEWGTTLETNHAPEIGTKTGYTNNGNWYTASSGGSVCTLSDAVVTDLNLYIHWEAKPVTVNFDMGYDGAPTWTPTYGNTVHYDNNIAHYLGSSSGGIGLDNVKPTRKHYTFEGWYWDTEKTKKLNTGANAGDDKNYGGTLIQDTYTFVKDSEGNYSITLYANWTPVYKYIKFYKDEQETDINQITSISALEGSDVTSDLINSVTAESLNPVDKSGEGKTFKGWKVYQLAKDGIASNPVNDVVYTASEVLTALPSLQLKLNTNVIVKPYYDTMQIKVHWMKTETEEFSLANGITKNYGATLGAYPSGVAPTREGYNFTGKWYKEAACTNEINPLTLVLNNDNATITSNEEADDSTTYHFYIYAGWEPKTYAVTYVYNYPGKEMDTVLTQPAVAYDTTTTKPASDPTRPNYTFEKWYKEAACTNEWNFASDKITGATTIYAGWTPNPTGELVQITGETNITAFTNATLTANCLETTYTGVSFKWYAGNTELTVDAIAASNGKYTLSGEGDSVLTVNNFQSGNETTYKAVLVLDGTSYDSVYDTETLTLKKIKPTLSSTNAATSKFTYSGSAVTANNVITGVRLYNNVTQLTLVDSAPNTYNKEYINADGITSKMYKNGEVVASATDAGAYTVTFSIGADSSGNYDTPADKSYTFTIEPKELTVTVPALSKTYDGNNNLPATTLKKDNGLSGFIGEDGADASVSVTGTYNSKDADTYSSSQISPTLGSLTGTSLGNYKLPTTGINYSNVNVISQKTLSLTVDNTAHSTKQNSAANISNQASDYHFSGLVSGDTIGSSDYSVTYAHKSGDVTLASGGDRSGATGASANTGTSTFTGTVYVNKADIQKNYNPTSFSYEITLEVTDKYVYNLNFSKELDTTDIDSSRLVDDFAANTNNYLAYAGAIVGSSSSLKENKTSNITATPGDGYTVSDIVLGDGAVGTLANITQDAGSTAKKTVYSAPNTELEDANKSVSIKAKFKPILVELADVTMAMNANPGTASTQAITPATGGSGNSANYSYSITAATNCSGTPTITADNKISFIPLQAQTNVTITLCVTDTYNGTKDTATYTLAGSNISKNLPVITLNDLTVTYDGKEHGKTRNAAGNDGFTITNYPEGNDNYPVTVKYRRAADGNDESDSTAEGLFADEDFPITSDRDNDWTTKKPVNAGTYTVMVETKPNDDTYEYVSKTATITINQDKYTTSLDEKYYAGASLNNHEFSIVLNAATAKNEDDNPYQVSGTAKVTSNVTVPTTAGASVTGVGYVFTPTSAKDRNNFITKTGTDGKVTAVGKETITITLEDYTTTYGSVVQADMEDAALSITNDQMTQDGGSLKYEYSGTSTDGTFSHASDWTTTMPTVAGTYSVRVTYTGTQYEGSDTAQLVINQKEITATWGNMVGVTKTFNNESAATLASGGVTGYNGILDADKSAVESAIQVKYDWSTENGTPTAHASKSATTVNKATHITGTVAWKTDATAAVIKNYKLGGTLKKTDAQATDTVQISPKQVTAKAEGFPIPTKDYDGTLTITKDANGATYALTTANFEGWVTAGSTPAAVSLSKTVGSETFTSSYTSVNANDESAQDMEWHISFTGEYGGDYYIASKVNNTHDDISIQGNIKRKAITFSINNQLSVKAVSGSPATPPAGSTVNLDDAGHTLATLVNEESLTKDTDYTITYALADAKNTGIDLDGKTTTMATQTSTTPAEFTATATLTSAAAKNYKFSGADPNVATATVKVLVSDATTRTLAIKKGEETITTDNIEFGTKDTVLKAVPSAGDGAITWAYYEPSGTESAPAQDVIDFTDNGDGTVKINTKKIGTTKLTATIAQTSEYISTTATVTIKVTENVVSITVEPDKLTYNAADRKENIKVTVTGKKANGDSYTLVEDTDYTVIYTKDSATTTDVKDVGDYFVTIEYINDNYKTADDEAEHKVTIESAGLTLGPITGTPTYKQTIELKDENITGQGEDDPSYTIQWYVANGATGTGTLLSGKTTNSFELDDYNLVGKYVYAVVTGTGNYDGDVESERKLVSPIALTGSVSVTYDGKTDTSDAYEGTELKPDLTKINELNNLDQSKFTYKWYTTEDTETPIGTGNTYTVTADTAGKDIYFVADYDYQGYEGTFTSAPLNIARYEMSNSTTDGTLSMTKQYLYNEFSQTVTITNNSNRSVTPKWEIIGTDKDKFTITPASPLETIASNGTATLTVTPQTGLEKGKYTATVRVLDSTYEQKGAITTFDIVFNVSELTKHVKFLDKDGNLIIESEVEYGKAADVPNPPDVKHYTFKNWQKVADDGTKTDITDMTIFDSVEDDITAQAYYEINTYLVKFLAKDGTTPIAVTVNGAEVTEQKVTYDQNATVATPPAVENYHFVKWIKLGSEEEVKDFTHISEDLTVVAVYEIDEHTVKFLNEDGTQIGAEQKVKHGEAANAPADPTKENYTFAGWVNVTNNQPVTDFDHIYDDLTVKATFTINSHKVKFFDEDGTTLLSEQTVEHGGKVTAKPLPTKENYSFVGWVDLTTGEKADDAKFENVTADMSVKATFTKITGGGGGGGGGGSTNSITIRYKSDDDKTPGEKVPGTIQIPQTNDPIDFVASFEKKLTNDKVIWKSSNEEVAIIDENGRLTIIKEGTTEITATAEANKNLTETIKVQITPPEATTAPIKPTPTVTPTDTPKDPSMIKKDMFNPYIVGYDDNVFGPELPISREEVATIFARLIANNLYMDQSYDSKFWDVTENEWSKDYIGYLEQFDVLHGYDDGSFMPKAYITRAEMAVMMARAEGYNIEGEMSVEETGYTDIPEGYTTWATKAIKCLTTAGVMEGYEDGTFRADQPITRAETVATVNRVLADMYADPIEVLPSDMTDAHWAYDHVVFAMNHRVLKDVAADPNKFIWSEEFDKNMQTITETVPEENADKESEEQSSGSETASDDEQNEDALTPDEDETAPAATSAPTTE